MKKNSFVLKILLLVAYCVPYSFLAVNGDGTSGTMMFYVVMAIGGLGGVAVLNDVYVEKINQSPPKKCISAIEVTVRFTSVAILIFCLVQGVAGIVHVYMDSHYEKADCYERTTEWTLDPLNECAYFDVKDYTWFTSKYDGQTFYLREHNGRSSSSRSYIYFSREQDAEPQEIPYYDSKLFFDDDPEAPSVAWIVMRETCYKAPLSGEEKVASTEYEIHIPGEEYILNP